MRVAVGQIDMVWEDKKASVAKAEKMICNAAFTKCGYNYFPGDEFYRFFYESFKDRGKKALIRYSEKDVRIV